MNYTIQLDTVILIKEFFFNKRKKYQLALNAATYSCMVGISKWLQYINIGNIEPSYL